MSLHLLTSPTTQILTDNLSKIQSSLPQNLSIQLPHISSNSTRYFSTKPSNYTSFPNSTRPIPLSKKILLTKQKNDILRSKSKQKETDAEYSIPVLLQTYEIIENQAGIGSEVLLNVKSRLSRKYRKSTSPRNGSQSPGGGRQAKPSDDEISKEIERIMLGKIKTRIKGESATYMKNVHDQLESINEYSRKNFSTRSHSESKRHPKSKYLEYMVNKKKSQDTNLEVIYKEKLGKEYRPKPVVEDPNQKSMKNLKTKFAISSLTPLSVKHTPSSKVLNKSVLLKNENTLSTEIKFIPTEESDASYFNPKIRNLTDTNIISKLKFSESGLFSNSSIVDLTHLNQPKKSDSNLSLKNKEYSIEKMKEDTSQEQIPRITKDLFLSAHNSSIHTLNSKTKILNRNAEIEEEDTISSNLSPKRGGSNLPKENIQKSTHNNNGTDSNPHLFSKSKQVKAIKSRKDPSPFIKIETESEVYPKYFEPRRGMHKREESKTENNVSHNKSVNDDRPSYIHSNRSIFSHNISFFEETDSLLNKIPNQESEKIIPGESNSNSISPNFLEAIYSGRHFSQVVSKDQLSQLDSLLCQYYGLTEAEPSAEQLKKIPVHLRSKSTLKYKDLHFKKVIYTDIVKNPDTVKMEEYYKYSQKLLQQGLDKHVKNKLRRYDRLTKRKAEQDKREQLSNVYGRSTSIKSPKRSVKNMKPRPIPKPKNIAYSMIQKKIENIGTTVKAQSQLQSPKNRDISPS